MVNWSLVRDFVAIAGVFIGLTYYVMNLREVKRNQRITLTTTMLQPFMTDEGYRQIARAADSSFYTSCACARTNELPISDDKIID